MKSSFKCLPASTHQTSKRISSALLWARPLVGSKTDTFSALIFPKWEIQPSQWALEYPVLAFDGEMGWCGSTQGSLKLDLNEDREIAELCHSNREQER